MKYLRDPRFPKLALTAFVVFKKERIVEVRKEQPHLLAIQMLRLINEEWELMSGKERLKYERESKKDKQRFDSEFARYISGDYSY